MRVLHLLIFFLFARLAYGVGPVDERQDADGFGYFIEATERKWQGAPCLDPRRVKSCLEGAPKPGIFSGLFCQSLLPAANRRPTRLDRELVDAFKYRLGLSQSQLEADEFSVCFFPTINGEFYTRRISLEGLRLLKSNSVNIKDRKLVIFLPGPRTYYEDSLYPLLDLAAYLESDLVTFNYRSVNRSGQVVGCNHSGCKVPLCSFADLVEDAFEVVSSFVVRGYQERNITILGHSLGGAVGIFAVKKLKKEGFSGFKVIADRTCGDLSAYVRSCVLNLPGLRSLALHFCRQWDPGSIVEAFLSLDEHNRLAINLQDDDVLSYKCSSLVAGVLETQKRDRQVFSNSGSGSLSVAGPCITAFCLPKNREEIPPTTLKEKHYASLEYLAYSFEPPEASRRPRVSASQPTGEHGKVLDLVREFVLKDYDRRLGLRCLLLTLEGSFWCWVDEGGCQTDSDGD